jgi:glycosyltransferase involved in cell wall biosynthesis
MSFLQQITPVVLTWNEEANVKRVFDKLNWAYEVVVVDSESNDRTVPMLQAYPNVRVITRPFTTHAEQWNHALTQTGLATEWALSLDADYVLSDELVREMRDLVPEPRLGGYMARVVYWSLGSPLRGSLYPPRVVLFRVHRSRFVQDGHTQRIEIEGPAGELRNPIHHDDRKDLARWLRSQAAYAELEAQRIALAPSHGAWADRLRSTGMAPLLAAAYALFIKGGIINGRPGLYYATQRAIAEAILALRLWERR